MEEWGKKGEIVGGESLASRIIGITDKDKLWEKPGRRGLGEGGGESEYSREGGGRRDNDGRGK